MKIINLEIFKKITLIIFLFFFTLNIYSQSELDKPLNELSADIARKLIQKNKTRVVVLYITDINKAQTVVGKYMADIISYNIVNNSGDFKVFDRDNLSGIEEAKTLISEGYVNAKTAKELGQILAVETIIIGNYTILNTSLKLILKALDVNSGFVIASSLTELPINADIAALLGVNIEGGTKSNMTGRGFNNYAVNSNVIYNNPETVDKECETLDVGDYCFRNLTNQDLKVYYRVGRGVEVDDYLTLKIGETQCYYKNKSGVYKFIATPKNKSVGLRSSWLFTGEFAVEKCKSKTYVFKD